MLVVFFKGFRFVIFVVPPRLHLAECAPTGQFHETLLAFVNGQAVGWCATTQWAFFLVLYVTDQMNTKYDFCHIQSSFHSLYSFWNAVPEARRRLFSAATDWKMLHDSINDEFLAGHVTRRRRKLMRRVIAVLERDNNAQVSCHQCNGTEMQIAKGVGGFLIEFARFFVDDCVDYNLVGQKWLAYTGIPIDNLVQMFWVSSPLPVRPWCCFATPEADVFCVFSIRPGLSLQPAFFCNSEFFDSLCAFGESFCGLLCQLTRGYPLDLGLWSKHRFESYRRWMQNQTFNKVQQHKVSLLVSDQNNPQVDQFLQMTSPVSLLIDGKNRSGIFLFLRTVRSKGFRNRQVMIIRNCEYLAMKTFTQVLNTTKYLQNLRLVCLLGCMHGDTNRHQFPFWGMAKAVRQLNQEFGHMYLTSTDMLHARGTAVHCKHARLMVVGQPPEEISQDAATAANLYRSLLECYIFQAGYEPNES